MKYVIALILWTMLALPTLSQTISKGEVKSFVNEVGDTLIIMHVDDAKLILGDIMEYQIADSIIRSYQEKDSVYSETIKLNKTQIEKLTQKTLLLEEVNNNLKLIVDNKDSIITIKDETIQKQNKEIKKQKRLKKLGFVGCVVLPIFTALAILL